MRQRVQKTLLSAGTRGSELAASRQSYWLRSTPHAARACAIAPAPFESTAQRSGSLRTRTPPTRDTARAAPAGGSTSRSETARRTPSPVKTVVTSARRSACVPSSAASYGGTVKNAPHEPSSSRTARSSACVRRPLFSSARKGDAACTSSTCPSGTITCRR